MNTKFLIKTELKKPDINKIKTDNRVQKSKIKKIYKVKVLHLYFQIPPLNLKTKWRVDSF